MKVSDYIDIVIKKITRNKKNKYMLILFTILSLLLISALTFKDNFYNLITNTLGNNVGFRSISVVVKSDESDLGKSELLNIDHVVSVYSSKYDNYPVESDFKSSEINGYIDLLYTEESTSPRVVYGDNLNEDDTGVAICPINFYPDSKAHDLFINQNNILKGKDLIGKTFQVSYYSYSYDGNSLIENQKYTKDFKIIGVYDSEKTMNTFNSCYISSKDMIEMKDLSSSEVEGVYYDFVVVVDNIKNVSTVQQKILELGFLDASIRSEIDQNIVNVIYISCDIIVSLILAVIFALTISYIKKKLINELKFNGILRAQGFSKKQLIKISLIEQFIINLIVYISSIILFIFLFIIVKFIINYYFISTFTILPLSLLNFIYIFICLVIFTTCIDFLYIKRYNKKSIVEMVRSEI